MRYWILFLALVTLGISACGDDADDNEPIGLSQQDNDSEQDCSPGETKCEDDGAYECDEQGRMQRVEECNDCEDMPEPHCPGDCGDGVISICAGDSIQSCATDQLESCHGGRCIEVGEKGICVAANGETCRGIADGVEFQLLCGDDDGVADDLLCDLASGECRPAAFDCGDLAAMGPDEFACTPSGDFLSACREGQPTGVLCEDNSTCSHDQSFNCYTEATAGTDCGGSTVCYPGLHCRQDSPQSASCVQPAGQLACTDTDVLTVCVDNDTAVACVEGAVFWWDDLSSWGGSCSQNTPIIAEGGNCIPGLVDCDVGLACDKSPFAIAGICRPPRADAPAHCTLSNQVSTGNSCAYHWSSCLDGNKYGIACQAQNVAGHIVTICDCFENEVKTIGGFAGQDLCQAESLEELDTLAEEKCGWDLLTTSTVL